MADDAWSRWMLQQISLRLGLPDDNAREIVGSFKALATAPELHEYISVRAS